MNYKYHRENSARGFVHMVHDLYGEESARALGLILRPLQQHTVEQYVRELTELADRAHATDQQWRRGESETVCQ